MHVHVRSYVLTFVLSMYVYTYRIERKSGKKGRSFLSSNSLTFKLFKLLTVAYLIYFWGVSLS